MKWGIYDNNGRDPLDAVFESEIEAHNHISLMGDSFKDHYKPFPYTEDKKVFRMLTEGLEAGDFRRILLPKISVDEYVPGNSDTDNVVIAFFISGVPEAIIPFRDFIMKTKGIIDVSYGNSETMPNTSIVYAEMSREDFSFTELFDLLKQVSRLSNIDIKDFSLALPTEKDMIPYTPEKILEYFKRRTIEKNLQAQEQAIKKTEEKKNKIQKQKQEMKQKAEQGEEEPTEKEATNSNLNKKQPDPHSKEKPDQPAIR